MRTPNKSLIASDVQARTADTTPIVSGAAGDMVLGVGVHTAGKGAWLYDGRGHPLPRLRVARTRWPMDLGILTSLPGRAAQTVTPVDAGGRLLGPRSTDRHGGQPGRRQPVRRSDRGQGLPAYEPTVSAGGMGVRSSTFDHRAHGASQRPARVRWNVSDEFGRRPREGWQKPCRQRSRPSVLSPVPLRRWRGHALLEAFLGVARRREAVHGLLRHRRRSRRRGCLPSRPRRSSADSLAPRLEITQRRLSAQQS